MGTRMVIPHKLYIAVGVLGWRVADFGRSSNDPHKTRHASSRANRLNRVQIVQVMASRACVPDVRSVRIMRVLSVIGQEGGAG